MSYLTLVSFHTLFLVGNCQSCLRTGNFPSTRLLPLLASARFIFPSMFRHDNNLPRGMPFFSYCSYLKSSIKRIRLNGLVLMLSPFLDKSNCASAALRNWLKRALLPKPHLSPAFSSSRTYHAALLASDPLSILKSLTNHYHRLLRMSALTSQLGKAFFTSPRPGSEPSPPKSQD